MNNIKVRTEPWAGGRAVKRVIAAASSCLLASCMTLPVSDKDIETADHGDLPSSYESVARNVIASQLKDPESARFEVGEPQCGYAQDLLVRGGGIYYGHLIPVAYNAKNGFGGYVGYRRAMVLITPGGAMDVSTNMILKTYPCPVSKYSLRWREPAKAP